MHPRFPPPYTSRHDAVSAMARPTSCAASKYSGLAPGEEPQKTQMDGAAFDMLCFLLSSAVVGDHDTHLVLPAFLQNGKHALTQRSGSSTNFSFFLRAGSSKECQDTRI